MIRRPPRSTRVRSSAASDVYKRQVIANGGVVVASTTPNTNAGTWNFTMPTDPYSFYYVRIDQADTDVAVTAPVWTGDVVKVGISSVVCSQDPQICLLYTSDAAD